MGINDLTLNHQLLAALYPESLVTMDTPIAASSAKGKIQPSAGILKMPENVVSYPYLGKNKRNVCFLVNSPEFPFLSDERLAFISKILGVCQYSLEDIAIVNTAKNTLRLDELRLQLDPHILFLWGVTAAESGISQAQFPDMTLSVLDRISVLQVSNPDVMNAETADSTEMKKKLWASLKKLFSL